jgi:hypothetical protein
LLSQHPQAIRFWFGDRKQYTTDFGLMEEIVCIFIFPQLFRRIRRIGRPGRIEVCFEVFSSRQHGDVDGEHVTEAQFAPWRRSDPWRTAKAASGDGASRIADRLANRLRKLKGI